MPSDFGGLDQIIQNYDKFERRTAELIAEYGENVIQRNGTWEDDTGSLRASVTGYEALTGDARKNYGNEPWAGAKAGTVKSRWNNEPYNYHEVEQEVDLGENDHAVGVVSAFVRYAANEGERRHNMSGIDTVLVEEAFLDALNDMFEYSDSAFTIAAREELGLF